ncbi:MAG TPA: helix-turn-helix transcriptional regulator [Steroidobacteraceae bacterium]|nr:helix-turn-helix transcriptional regulator [Steroidobacteraceae bacterium]
MVVVEPPLAEEDLPLAEPVETATSGSWRRARDGDGRSNALGVLIERRFADPTSPVRSYSDLERRSGVSREALSRYVTARADRRRSPTIETLAAIADALRISLEQVCRAAVAGAHGQLLPDAIEQRAREEVLMPLASTLSDSQFDALVELLRQLQRREPEQ